MKSALYSVAGVILLETDTWIFQTEWVALLGVGLMVYSFALCAREVD